MHMVSGFLALALLAGDGPAQVTPSIRPAGPVRFEIRLLEMKGLDWRGPLHERLSTAARQGTACVWTAHRDVISTLEKAAEKTLTAPTILAQPGTPACVKQNTVRRMVQDVRRVADGLPGQNTSLAFVPEIGEIDDSFTAEVACRPVDQGLMASVALKDCRFLALHTVTVPGSVTNPNDKTVSAVNAQIQVPEVVSGAVNGEWLIPTDGVLVASLGAYTTSDPKGKAVVRERVVVIEPKVTTGDEGVAKASFDSYRKEAMGSKSPAPEAAPKPLAAGPGPIAPPVPIGPSMLLPLASPTIAPQPAWRASLAMTAGVGVAAGDNRAGVRIFGIPLPIAAVGPNPPEDAKAPAAGMPALPTRGLPTPIAADGTVVALPPLPDEDVMPSSGERSDEPRPAPQGRPFAKPAASPSWPSDRPLPVRSATARVTQFEARGNTMIVRDPEDGTCRLVCDDLVLFPAPKSLVQGEPECLEEPSACPVERILREGIASRLASKRIAPQADAATRVEYREVAEAPPEDGGEEETSTLGLQLNSGRGGCDYDSTVNLKSLEKEPITIRVPMADGSVVEVMARVVKKAPKK